MLAISRPYEILDFLHEGGVKYTTYSPSHCFACEFHFQPKAWHNVCPLAFTNDSCMSIMDMVKGTQLVHRGLNTHTTTMGSQHLIKFYTCEIPMVTTHAQYAWVISKNKVMIIYNKFIIRPEIFLIDGQNTKWKKRYKKVYTYV